MHLNQLYITRFIAAILVVIFHFGLKVPPFYSSFFKHLILNGNVFVIYFFILSGFILSISYSKKIFEIKYSEYLFLRLARIYPLFLLSIILVWLHKYFSGQNIQMGHFLKVLSLSHGWINPWSTNSGIEINPPAWTLSLELGFYLMFPFLCRLLLNKTMKTLIFTIILCIVYNFLIQNFNGLLFERLKINIPTIFIYFQTFLAGVALGILFLKAKKRDLKYSRLPILIVIASLSFFLFAINYLGATMGNSYICFLIVIYFLSIDISSFQKLLSNEIFIFLGNISYGIYILQFPIYNITESLFPSIKLSSHLLFFYLYFLILLIASTFFYYFYEIRLLSFLKDYLKSKKTAKINLRAD